MRRHEAAAGSGAGAGAGRQPEQAAFTAHRFTYQEGLGIRVVQAGRMELDELHVGDPAAGTPCHRDAVAGRGVGVGGVQVDLAGAACRQHRVAGGDGDDPAVLYVLHIHADAAAVVAGRPDQVDRNVLFQQHDVRVVAHLLFQGRLDRMARGVGGMDDAARAVAAFARQVVAQFGGGIAGEGHALFDQPADRLAAMFDDITGDLLVAQAGAGVERIGEVAVGAVG
jgi:hypothetical protein